MPCWEYCFFWSDELNEYGYLTFIGEKGTEAVETRPGNREDFLKFKAKVLMDLGSEGWELASTTAVMGQGETLYFKRLAAVSNGRD